MRVRCQSLAAGKSGIERALERGRSIGGAHVQQPPVDLVALEVHRHAVGSVLRFGLFDDAKRPI
ncbi:MAG: hypothetical protein ACLPIG_02230 [Methylocella sp.]